MFTDSVVTTPYRLMLLLTNSLMLLKVTGSQRKADVCVGGKSWNTEAKSVSEQWILGQF